VNSTGFFRAGGFDPNLNITGKLPPKKPEILSSSHLFQVKSTNEHTNMSATSEKWILFGFVANCIPQIMENE